MKEEDTTLFWLLTLFVPKSTEDEILYLGGFREVFGGGEKVPSLLSVSFSGLSCMPGSLIGAR